MIRNCQKKNCSKAQMGFVLQATRRRATVLASCGEVYRGGVKGSLKDPAVGDIVSIDIEKESQEVEEILPRRNLLRRSYFGKTKNLAANVDRLFIVTAPEPLYNSQFIDRALVAAAAEGISTTIICNKLDIAKGRFIEELSEIYSGVVSELLFVSCRSGEGVDQIRGILDVDSGASDSRFGHSVFCGVSGVGKSSLLNLLVPNAFYRVGQVSVKTGQGKQTTSAAIGAVFAKVESGTKIITDTPGLQHFGLTHIDCSALAGFMPDIFRYSVECNFRDCRHTVEPLCSVREAVVEKKIAQSRYKSFLEIHEELRGCQRY
jgi:ribosome biogenesis GTPase